MNPGDEMLTTRSGTPHTTRRVLNDVGQTTIEWLMILATSVAIIAAVMVYTNDLGGTVSETIICLSERVLGGGECGAHAPQVAGPNGSGEPTGPPTDPCTLEKNGLQIGIDGRIVILDLGADFIGSVSTKSDGTYSMTVLDKGTVGLSGKLGAEAKATVNGHGLTVEGNVKLGGEGYGALGSVYEFQNEEDVDAFIRYMIYDRTSSMLPLSSIIRPINEFIMGEFPGNAEPVASVSQVGLKAGLGADAELTLLEVGADAEGKYEYEKAALKTTKIDGSSSTTYTVSHTLTAAAGLSAGPLDGQVGGKDKESQKVTINRNPQGEVVSVSIAQVNEGGVTAQSELSDEIADPLAAFKEANGKISGSGTDSTEVKLSVDLTTMDDAERSQVLNTLADLLDGDISDLQSLEGFQDALRNNAQLTILTHANSESTAELSGKLNAGIGIGAGIGGKRTNSVLTDAYYYDLGSNQLEQWTTCTNGF